MTRNADEGPLMSNLSEAVRKALDNNRSAAISDDLFLTVFGDGVINVGAQGRELENADVVAVRAAFTEAGYVEVDSWVATQGMTWLSDGIKSVSFRIRPRSPEGV